MAVVVRIRVTTRNGKDNGLGGGGGIRCDVASTFSFL